jgi:transposase-like protein
MFWISMAMQWMLMHPINRMLTIKSQKLELKRLDKIAEIGDIESKQITTLKCAYCGEENGVLIDVNGENSFKCKSCKNDNNVVFQYSTVRTTNPLLTDLQTAREDVYGKLAEVAEVEDDNGY